jgi:hypothetical protein
VFSNQFDGSSWSPKSYIYWGSGSGYSRSDRTGLSTNGAYGNAVGDLNRDGYPDLVFSCEYDGTSYDTDSMVFWGSATGYSDGNRALLPTRGAHECTVADLNADGWPDLVFSNFYTGTSHTVDVYIYWGSSSGFSTAGRQGLPAVGCTGTIAEDFNGDGWLDLFVSNFVADPSNYNMDSYIYWGSSGGFSAANRTSIAGHGAIGAGAACGSVPSAESTFGTLEPAPSCLAINTTGPGENYTVVCNVGFFSNPGYRDVRGGAVFGFVNRSNYYFCSVAEREDAVSLYRMTQGRLVRLARAGTPALVEGVFHNLTVDVTGARMLVYLDGSLMLNASDGGLRAGLAGLISSGGEVRFRPELRSAKPEHVNRAPRLELGSPVNVQEDQPFTIKVNATDPDLGVDPAEKLTFRDDSSLFDIDTSTGVISFTPRQADVGEILVNITVTDRAGLSDTGRLVLRVQNVNDPPSGVRIIFPQNGSGFPSGSRLQLTGTGADEDPGDVLRFFWYDNGRPVGAGREMNLTLAPGTHLLRLEVSDGAVTVSDQVTVKVQEPPGETSSMLALWILLAVCAVVAVLVAAMFLARRKSEYPR